MADEVEMIPVEMTPVSEPPKADPLSKPAMAKAETIKLNPLARPAAKPGTMTGLKPGLKLPPKPGAFAGLKPGLKLPPKPGMTAGLKPGLKLPPKPGATVGLKPGLKLPPKPGATVAAAKPGANPPSAPIPAHTPAAAAPKPSSITPIKPIIRKPGEGATATVAPLPKPVTPITQISKPAAAAKPLEQLKTVTQKLKGITQEIPQQAILHKTGIIAEGSMEDAQKEAAKNKTSRISLSDAMGVAPVKNENTPMKTIRIKRPVDLPNSTQPLKPQPALRPVAAVPASAPAAENSVPVPPATAPAAEQSATVTQRKTLKVPRPGGLAVRPTGKFGVKKPGVKPTVAKPAAKPADGANPAEGEVADIPETPSTRPVPTAKVQSESGAAWTISALVSLAACGVMGALAWFLYQNSQMPTYCGGLGWGGM